MRSWVEVSRSRIRDNYRAIRGVVGQAAEVMPVVKADAYRHGAVEVSRVLEAEGVKWLAQGTIYPDVIESAGSKTGKAHVIKSHHNVGGLPKHMKLKLLEPATKLVRCLPRS